MKRFQYSLETLLSLRKEREQECEMALAFAAGKLADINNRIEAALLTGNNAFMGGVITIDDMRLRDRILLKSVNDCKALEKPRLEASEKVDEARTIYADAHSQRAALDRLREKRMEHCQDRAGHHGLESVCDCSLNRFYP